MNANEPRTNNPGLGNYVGRTVGIVIFLLVVFVFAAVHFFYATSALLDILAVFLLFTFFFFLGLSMACLWLCARVGPGDLPSRFSAARMETFIREELQRLLGKARPAQGDAAAQASTTKTEKVALYPENTAAAAPSSVASTAAGQKRWADLDDEEKHQLANVASTAALTHRASPMTAEAEWERTAMEARLRVQEERVVLSSSDDDEGAAADDGEGRQRRHRHHHRPQEGDGVDQEDGSIHNSADDEVELQELPAYMPEMMRLRRQRKMRRGLAIVRVSEAAQKVLEAIDSEDFDRKREEMSYLIPGANWCRFCSFYQMNDTHHCTVCCRCVYRTKLHCVCCGSCIGYANSKYYVLFLFYFIMAFLMANFLDLYCINWGYTYFFKASGESNSIYYLVFVYSYSFVAGALLLLIQYLLAAGRNVGLLTEMLRQQREELQSIEVCNSGEQYQLVLSERTASVHDTGHSSPEQAREPFRWRRAMDTVGEGLPLPLWFWPVPTRPAVKEMDDPEGFWTNLTEAIRIRLRSVADDDDVFTDEDEAADGFHSDAAGVGDERAKPPASLLAAVQPSHEASASPIALLPVPFRAKSTEVTMVPVPEETERPRASATLPVPPIAKAAPAHSADSD